MYLVLFGVVVILVVFFVVRRSRRPLSADAVASKIDAMVRRLGRKAGDSSPGRREASLLLHYPTRGLDVLAEAEGLSIDAFHVASVGKLFTAVLVGRLIDEGAISLETTVATVLDPGVIEGLFVVEGEDHRHEVTVRHLLGHTSGLGDYFEDPCRDGKNMVDLIVSEPERRWTPETLLGFARDQLTAVGTPGERYRYSDVGYVILGLLVEKLRGRPFHEVLHRDIFEPLNMERSWMPYRSSPAVGEENIRRAFLQGTDVSGFPSITADWTGGGVASTERDLLRFSRALWNGELLSGQLLDEMTKSLGRFNLGMHYGLGFMEYRFGEFLFLLKGLPHMYGHMGVLSTQLFCEPKEDIHVVVNLASDKAHASSVRLVISALRMGRRTYTPAKEKG